jgi:hypothetical protein
MNVCEGVRMSVPSAKAEVEAADAGEVIVDDDNLECQGQPGRITHQAESRPSHGETRIQLDL